jgi:hypothetical protein
MTQQAYSWPQCRVDPIGIHPALFELKESINLTSSLSTYLYMYALAHFYGTWMLFSFLNLYIVNNTPWTEDRRVARPLYTRRTTHT